MSGLPNAPVHHVVMDPGAHKGIDYVNGDFGAKARIDHRALQLRWFDHYLKGVDNGVDAQAPLDLFIIGDNTWRKEREWPPVRCGPISTCVGTADSTRRRPTTSRPTNTRTIRLIPHPISWTRASWS